jgi:hypothetical protein
MHHGTVRQEAETGAPVAEGGVIQTENRGDAAVRYFEGTAVSVPGAGNGPMEASAPPGAPARETAAGRGAQWSGAMPRHAPAGEPRPSIELRGIIPFGRSLELIGQVEAGSSLVVNDETVEVAWDGSFKHFTDPFPAAARNARLTLKVTDLAGRTRILTRTHDFGPEGGGR